MKNISHSSTYREHGRSVVPILLLVCALLAVVWWFRHSAGPGLPTLSQPSLAAIARLDAPIEIRFYSGVDASTAGKSLPAFEERARQLLRAYQTAGSGKVALKELQVTNDDAATLAIADGIRPFNIEKGDASFLGIVVQAGDKKEILPVLSPDYESALEADVTRALTRAADVRNIKQAAAPSDTPDELTVDKVKTLVPNYSTVSLEEGSKALTENMLSELHKAGSDFEAKLAEARTALEKAEAAGNQADLAAARKAVTTAELAHVETLKRIVSSSTAQNRALEQLKSGKQ